MDDRRLLIAIAMAGLILLGWPYLMNQMGLRSPAPAHPATTSQSAATQAPAAVSTPKPSVPLPGANTTVPYTPGRAISRPALRNEQPESLSVVDTDAWKVVLTNRGAQPAHWVLKTFHRGDRRPMDLIPADGGLEALVLRRTSGDVDFSRASFQVLEDRDSAGVRIVAYRSQDSAGTGLVVRYRLPRTGELASVSYEVPNVTPEEKLLVQWRSWKFNTETNQTEDLRQARVSSLLGEALIQDHWGDFRKIPEKAHSGNVQWAILRSKYFALGFLFPQDALDGVTTLGYPDSMQVGVRFEYALRGRNTAGYDMYLGPVDFWKLQPAGHNLTRLVDSGFKPMVPLNRLMLKFFTLTHKFVPNYGLVIIVLSVLMRLAFYPLSQSQMRSMQKMQDLQPEMERVRQKYKSDQEKLNREVLRLYKENNVNPFGGCLPILFQMPVFISLYNVLSASIELRQAGFVGWISDLSAPDVLMTLGPVVGGFPLHVLPLIMAATMFWQQKLTPMDPRQATTGYIMPFVMLFIFYKMPSGLVLYWTVTNILTALQQMRIRTRKVPAAVAS